MSLVVTNQSRALMLELIVNKLSSANNESRKLKLFTNNIVPSLTTQIGDLTECSSIGYNEKELTGSTWTVSTVDGITSANYEEQLFTLEEADSIYGYFVTNSDGTQLLWVERFEGAPFSLPSGGGTVGVELNFTLN